MLLSEARISVSFQAYFSTFASGLPAVIPELHTGVCGQTDPFSSIVTSRYTSIFIGFNRNPSSVKVMLSFHRFPCNTISDASDSLCSLIQTPICSNHIFVLNTCVVPFLAPTTSTRSSATSTPAYSTFHTIRPNTEPCGTPAFFS